MEAFAGIDVAFAKKKRLPICVCVLREGILEPLLLRNERTLVPPCGHGNVKSLDATIRRNFAESAARYLHDVERFFKVTIRRIAIDSPSDPKDEGSARRAAEKALDKRGISCITTPDASQFKIIRAKAEAHLSNGGDECRLPHANQLWMLVGFELFRRLRKDWECIEVFPHAIAVVLGAANIHKSTTEGLFHRLCSVARFTGWPKPLRTSALQNVAFGGTHDKLDAYLSAWVASLDSTQREPLGVPPNDAIWVPIIK